MLLKYLLCKDLWRSIAYIFFTREKPKQKKAVHNSSLNTQLYCGQEGTSSGVQWEIAMVI